MFRDKPTTALFLLSLVVVVTIPAYLFLVVQPNYQEIVAIQAEANAVRSAGYMVRMLNLERGVERPDQVLRDRLEYSRIDEQLIKIKLFSATGKVVYSSDPEEIGEINARPYFTNQVMLGKIYSKVVEKDRRTAEGRDLATDVVETYVPIMTRGDFAGAFELYYDISDDMARLRGFARQSLLTILAVSSSFLLAVVVLLSARRKTLSELDRSRFELASTVDNIPVGVFRCDTSGTLVWCNSLANLFLSDAPLGLPVNWRKACLDEDAERVVAGWERVTEGGKRFKDEFRLNVGGMPVWVQCEVVPEYDAHEKIVGFIGSLTDTSEIRQMETEIKDAQFELMKQDKMASVGRLAAGVAHEINNPMGFVSSNLSTLGKYLASMVSYSEGLSQVVASSAAEQDRERLDKLKTELKIDYLVDDAADLLVETTEGIERVRKIVQTLKDYARIDQSEEKQEDLNECINTSLELISGQVPPEVKIEAELGELPLITCSAHEVQQALLALLSNSLHAVEGSGRIMVRSRREGDRISIEVSDDGVGIAPAHLRHIFDPFFTTRSVGSGTGLGLTMVYDLTRKYGGEANAESELGKGTSITLTLPLDS